MRLDAEDLNRISQQTLRHYEDRAAEFRAGTLDHDVSQNIAVLLDNIQGSPPYRILDFGCGPGRDLRVFAAQGHHAVGLDGASRFVEMAREASGCEVWRQDFLMLDLPTDFFDGIYANASLFHVPSQELPRVLAELRTALKAGGVLFTSNPRGANEEGWNHGRYGAYHDIDTWRSHVEQAGFVEITHYYRPAGLPRDQQPWLASVWRADDQFRAALAASSGVSPS